MTAAALPIPPGGDGGTLAGMSDLLKLHRLDLRRPGEELFAVVAESIPGFTRRQARLAVMGGLVNVDGNAVLVPKHPLGARAVVHVDLRQGVQRAYQARMHDEPVSGAQPFTILHEDADLVVVDKAPGVLSAPMGKAGPGEKEERGHVPELLRRVWRKQGHEANFIGVVHRLDKDTSGCIVFALSRTAQRILGTQFAGEAAGRLYRCLVLGSPPREADELHQRQGRGAHGRRAVVDEDEPGKEAVTRYRVVGRHGPVTELEVELGTGRTHQIRIALSELGCPVAGDRLYRRSRPGEVWPRAPRLMLHAWKLGLDHPSDGHRLAVTAPMPPEFSAYAAEAAKLPVRPVWTPPPRGGRPVPAPAPAATPDPADA